MADWHQLAPGGKTTPVMSADNRVAMIVWSGQVRVSIKGQEPFVASKGFEINVPLRLPYSLETVGSEPGLWLEVHQAGDIPVYPVETTPNKPADVKGYTYTKTIMWGGDGVYDGPNKPYLDYYKDVVGRSARARRVHRQRPHVREQHPRQGHAHAAAEQSRSFPHRLRRVLVHHGGSRSITRSRAFRCSPRRPGDVVTAEVGRWHRASLGGTVGEMATRVAINPFPRGLHNYTPESNGRQ